MNDLSSDSHRQEVNPHLRQILKKKMDLSLSQMVKGILQGDTGMLSRAITLVESTRAEDRNLAADLIRECLPHSGRSQRIGITGVPGVGKSTFIETFGSYLIQKQNRKVAVLAVDPSSQVSHGSILGDKTRMEALSQSPLAFIRPSPSAGSLGGVARKTREAIILCEAAGFDTIIIETVGVGQSETTVKSMVDLFMLLLLPGAGDELQGIKKGIMEMADLIVIHKADGDNAKRANLASADVRRALRLYPEDPREWTIPVELCSSLEETGIEDIWMDVEKFFRHGEIKGFIQENRKEQAEFWLRESVGELLHDSFFQHPRVAKQWPTVKKEVIEGRISPFEAARSLMSSFTGDNSDLSV
ncbi:MAG: methylmalonyl Co-A mutase-associated GTPase MeaB [Bacteroidota bacterium]|nr:methylmalonyl Co-A mutase-associated GTPase MeaB [Bacteroidota bacterium]MDX5506250.1 methylmalonyl Co-A mutase-associated GTPase MeaB [Bacteroidota bacterium]